MRQLSPGGLALSPGLRSADPAALARWSAGMRSAAHALLAGARQLGGLCAALPGGIWMSPAAAAFAGKAQEQARRLGIVAALFENLATAAGQLASELGQAQEQALAAVARGARVDIEVHAFNDRMRAQHALLPQDPDSLLVSEPEADELSGQLAAASGELADAESRARSAWQAGAASFDLVGYATPAMRGRMSSPSWDPANAVSLAAAGAARIDCGPMETLGLPVNGILTGPDGRAYPLLVQSALGPDGKLLITPQESPADLQGWTPLAVRLGTTAVGRKATWWEKIAVVGGGAAGAAYPTGSSFAPDLLSEIHVMGDGGAYLSPIPSAPIDSVKEASADAPRGQEVASYWIAPETGLAGGARATVPDAIGLVDGLLGGIVVAKHLDDGRAADYRVVFEENTEGELRARLQLYRALDVPGEQPRVLAADGYVDSSGHLQVLQTTGNAPGIQAELIPAGG
jgi:hypothetical protein